MKFIYNENQYAKKVLVSKKVDKQNGKTIAILCKYYYFNLGKTKQQIFKLLSKFINETAIDYDKNHLVELIDKYTDQKNAPVNIQKINITISEIAKIMSREDKNEQKILYSMLVAYKCKNERLKLMDGGRFVGNLKVSETWIEYFKDMKIKSDKVLRASILRNLEKDGLIWVNNDTKKTIELKFVDDESPVAFELNHFHDIWVEFMMYSGEKYKRCECCGSGIKLTKKKCGANSKYCSSECYKYADKEMSLNRYYKTKK